MPEGPGRGDVMLLHPVGDSNLGTAGSDVTSTSACMSASRLCVHVPQRMLLCDHFRLRFMSFS